MTDSSSKCDGDFAALAAAIAACRICRERPLGAPLPHAPRPVFHARPGARLLVASQAPGTRVHVSGLPFDDASGDRLRDWMGVTRERFYDTRNIAFLPMGFCFPGQDGKGGDLPPRRECALAWRERALAALPDIRCVLLVGGYAQRWHLTRAGLAVRGESLGATLARWRDIYAASAPRLLVLPHPSWRNNARIAQIPDFETGMLPIVRREVAAALAI